MIQLINVGTTTIYKLLLWFTLIKSHICTSCQLKNYGSSTIASEENCPQNLTLTLTQTLTHTGGQFSSEEIVHIPEITYHFVLCSLLSDWTYFWNKYCNLSFPAICCSQFLLLIFIASSWFQKANIALRMSMRNKKKWLDVFLKGFVKQSIPEQSTTFLSFSFLNDCCMSILSLFLSKSL